MATITAGEFRNGKVFEMEGKYYQVVEFQHVKPGKGCLLYTSPSPRDA